MTMRIPGPETPAPEPTIEQLRESARLIAEELPSMEEMMANWIDTAGFAGEPGSPLDPEAR